MRADAALVLGRAGQLPVGGAERVGERGRAALKLLLVRVLSVYAGWMLSDDAAADTALQHAHMADLHSEFRMSSVQLLVAARATFGREGREKCPLRRVKAAQLVGTSRASC